MKILPVAVTVAAILGSGCIVVPRSTHVAPRSGAVVDHDNRAERCPPGHQWRDGRCHERGRGNDRDRDRDRR